MEYSFKFIFFLVLGGEDGMARRHRPINHAAAAAISDHGTNNFATIRTTSIVTKQQKEHMQVCFYSTLTVLHLTRVLLLIVFANLVNYDNDPSFFTICIIIRVCSPRRRCTSRCQATRGCAASIRVRCSNWRTSARWRWRATRTSWTRSMRCCCRTSARSWRGCRWVYIRTFTHSLF